MGTAICLHSARADAVDRGGVTILVLLVSGSVLGVSRVQQAGA